MDDDLACVRVPLKFGCVATVITADTDRGPYVPPPVSSADHHETCLCGACVKARLARQTGRHIPL